MKTHCRCRRCEARRVLARHPDEYIRQPKCRNCGAKDWRADKWMNCRPVRKMTCFSECMHFPHRMGCRGCWYTVAGDTKPYDQLAEELTNG